VSKAYCFRPIQLSKRPIESSGVKLKVTINIKSG
jgi:hypothetical protein